MELDDSTLRSFPLGSPLSIALEGLALDFGSLRLSSVSGRESSRVQVE